MPNLFRRAAIAGLALAFGIAALFAGLIAWYIAQQTQHWRRQQGLA